MALVKVDKHICGLVLAENVYDTNSRLVLAKGQKIDDKHIRIMKMWGIFEVEIDGQKTKRIETDDGIDLEQMKVVKEQVKRLFQAVDIKNPTIKEVVRIVIQYRLKHPVIEKKDTVLDSVDHVKTNNYSNIMQKIDRIDVKLPEVPTLVFELNEIIANPMSSASDIARIINKSPSLTATLLKIVNSAFYGLRSKIDSISRAVMLMGSKEVSNLAMGITIMETFKDIPKEVMDVSSFLEHNLACGIVARILAAHSKMSNTEQLFVSGMLHDIGRLIFCKYFPEYSVLAFTMAEQSTIPLYKAEQKIFGCTHTQIGKKLLNKWKLPILLVDNVYYHHQPSSAPNPAMAATLQMADIIVHGLGIGSSAEQVIPAFDEKAWQRTNLPIGAFPSLIKQAEHQLKTFREFLTKGNS